MIQTEVTLLLPKEKTDEVLSRLNVICTESFEGVQRPSFGTLRNRVETGDVIVSRLFGTIVGFALVIEKNGTPYICCIAVDPKYRGQTIGKQLLKAVERFIRVRPGPKDFIELAVKTDNPAQKLYFDAGYRVRAFARGFYGDEGDGLLMRRDL